MDKSLFDQRVFYRIILIIAISFYYTTEPVFAQVYLSIKQESSNEKFARLMMEGDRQPVYADGEIRPGDAVRLRDFLARNNIKQAIIVFNSPGGDLVEALRIGRMLREGCHDTRIGTRAGSQGVCASACAYAFAGGVNRYYSAKYGRLGLHQFDGGNSEANAVSRAQEMSGLLVAYLTSMGVDALAFSVSTRVKPAEIAWLSERDALDLGFSNNGVQPTRAELKMVNMDPYLKIEQEKREGSARVIFFCDAGQINMMAGVVTSPDLAEFHSAISIKSYIELNGSEYLVSGPGGVKASGSVMWLNRQLSASVIQSIISANTLGIWTEGGGAFRWGIDLDLDPARRQLRQYIQSCVSAR